MKVAKCPHTVHGRSHLNLSICSSQPVKQSRGRSAPQIMPTMRTQLLLLPLRTFLLLLQIDNSFAFLSASAESLSSNLQCLSPPCVKRDIAHRHGQPLFRRKIRLRAQKADVSRASTWTTDPFDWTNQWYPLVPVQDLDPDGPNKLTILGMDIVVWRTRTRDSTSSVGGGTVGSPCCWNAFRDACPHRLVPLSEGRLDSTPAGNTVLQCAYHGWEFDDNGKCVRIPQISPTSPAIDSPRACATLFPTAEVQGLLWVFPNADADRTLIGIPDATIDELDDDDKIDATNFYCRDLPYDVSILIENLCDPSHIPFAHHSMMAGADRNDVDRIDMEIVEEHHNGFLAKKIPYPAGKGRYDVKFQAPCLLYYTIVDEKGKSYVGLGTYCIPTAPGRCRLIARFPFKLSFKPAMAIIKKTPRFVTHMSQNVVLDSDVVFLSSQDELLERNNARGGNYTTSPNYYMPAKCDGMVVAFRKWWGGKGGGGPTWLGIPAQRSDGEPTGWLRPRAVPQRGGRDALLDRYRQHTELCSSCRRAHKALYLARELCQGVGIGLIAAAAAGAVGTASSATGSVGKKVLASAGAALLLAPRLLIQPLVARLEIVPWPRKQWRSSKNHNRK